VKIENLDGMSQEQLEREVRRGGKFFFYQYCVSLILITFKRPTSIYFVRSGESGAKYSWKYTLLTFLLGWWGIPWGPVYTVQCLYKNMSGGIDVTKDVMRGLTGPAE